MYAIRIGDKFGIGATSYDAMVNAVGEVICQKIPFFIIGMTESVRLIFTPKMGLKSVG